MELLSVDLAKKGGMQYLISKSFRERVHQYIEVAEAIKFLHDYGIVHQDINPANIMGSDNYFSHLKIIDFGSATNSNYFVENQKLNLY